MSNDKRYSFSGLHDGRSEVVLHGLTIAEINYYMTCDLDDCPKSKEDCWNCKDSDRFMKDLEENGQAVSVVYREEDEGPTATSVAWYEGLMSE